METAERAAIHTHVYIEMTHTNSIMAYKSTACMLCMRVCMYKSTALIHLCWLQTSKMIHTHTHTYIYTHTLDGLFIKKNSCVCAGSRASSRGLLDDRYGVGDAHIQHFWELCVCVCVGGISTTGMVWVMLICNISESCVCVCVCWGISTTGMVWVMLIYNISMGLCVCVYVCMVEAPWHRVCVAYSYNTCVCIYIYTGRVGCARIWNSVGADSLLQEALI